MKVFIKDLYRCILKENKDISKLVAYRGILTGSWRVDISSAPKYEEDLQYAIDKKYIIK